MEFDSLREKFHFGLEGVWGVLDIEKVKCLDHGPYHSDECECTQLCGEEASQAEPACHNSPGTDCWNSAVMEETWD